MNINTVSLEYTQKQIEDVKNKIDKFFRAINSTINPLAFRDSSWGKYTFSLHIRLDEFSITTLEEALPDLKRLFAEFEILRDTERNILKEIELARQLQKDTFGPFNY